MALLMEEELMPLADNDAPLSPAEEESLRAQVMEWRVEAAEAGRELVRRFAIPDYRRALDFVHDLGSLAEAEDHHPQMTVERGAVTVRWSTHSLKGLHRNDFIMAARTDELYDVTRRSGAPS